MMKEEMVVTFGCSDSIHLYKKDGGIKPNFPYRIHPTMDDAKNYMGKEDVKIIRHYKEML